MTTQKNKDTIKGLLKYILMVVAFLKATSCATTVKYLDGTLESKNGIALLENVNLNGLKHAVLMRGENIDNPILLHIHPLGIPSMCFANEEYTEDSIKEKNFLIVHYDQRGFGKTYRKHKHGKKYINTEQYIRDAEELIKYLQEKFDKQKIYLLAESWGTVIGLNLVSEHPDWFYAYIAVPQVVNVKEALSDAYDFSLSEAKSDNNEDAISELEKYGKPTPELSGKKLNKSIGKLGKWMDYYNMKRYNGQDMTGYFFASLWKSPEYSMLDFVSTLNGIGKTAAVLNEELIKTDLSKEINEIRVPTYFIIGEYDLYLKDSKKYFDKLNADNKHWIPIKNAGHMVRGEQNQIFSDLLYNVILPETLTVGE